MTEIHIFAMAAQGKGLSGSDRIFIEFARRWQKKANVYIYVNEEGREMCRRQNLREGKSIRYRVWNTKKWQKYGFVTIYLVRIFRAIFESTRITISNQPSTIIYSASEFWMDSLPTLILKLRFPNIKWVASWYQTAPNPFIGFTEGKRREKYRGKALLYWLAQLPIKPLIAYFSNFILINNKSEKRYFNKFERKLVVVLGAVDINTISRYIKKYSKLPKMYEAVFQGRFHPQKGVVELVEIWRLVVNKMPKAKLAMIGNGPLMNDVKQKISDLGLTRNISLKGYVFDGYSKFKIFAQSKIVVHPAFFDSGGMASAEAMAFGLPCVGFDLPAYTDYYPTGMLKCQTNNIADFSKHILSLLNDTKLYSEMAKSAQRLVFTSMSWDNRANEVLRKLL